MSEQPAPVQVGAMWSRLNETIVRLLEYIPDDKMDWSPQENLWNFRGVLLHTIAVRDGWLANAVKDGVETPNVLALAQTKGGMREQLGRTWQRVERFLSDDAALDATYTRDDGPEFRENGHWIAFHLLEHDIHHRADLFHYLALLGIDHPDIGTP